MAYYKNTEKKNPFLEIEVVKLEDPNRGEKEILEIIKKRNDKNNPFESQWIGTAAHPKLRLDYPTIKLFEDSYKRGLDMLDHLLERIKKRSIDLEKLLALSELRKFPPVNKDLYLILKYTTNYKKPLRVNYQYTQWFADYFHEMVRTEEVVDGFLHMFKREIDFMNANLDKLDPQELRIWLKNKKPDISEQVIHQLLQSLSEKI